MSSDIRRASLRQGHPVDYTDMRDGDARWEAALRISFARSYAEALLLHSPPATRRVPSSKTTTEMEVSKKANILILVRFRYSSVPEVMRLSLMHVIGGVPVKSKQSWKPRRWRKRDERTKAEKRARTASRAATDPADLALIDVGQRTDAGARCSGTVATTISVLHVRRRRGIGSHSTTSPWHAC